MTGDEETVGHCPRCEQPEPPETVGQPITAGYPGQCPRCDRGIQVGDLIARVALGGGYVHAGRCPQ